MKRRLVFLVAAKLPQITIDFTCIRCLGDKQGIERVAKDWTRVVVDRTAGMTNWVDVCKRFSNAE
jgi:hypothetical protein